MIPIQWSCNHPQLELGNECPQGSQISTAVSITEYYDTVYLQQYLHVHELKAGLVKSN
jgi:hypothetical protein